MTAQTAPALNAASAAADTAQAWLTRSPALHPSLLLRQVSTNAVTLWKAIHDNLEVPAPVRLDSPATLMVWRKGLQPISRPLDAQQSAWVSRLAEGASVAQACEAFAGSALMPEVSVFGQWLAAWWDDEIMVGETPDRTGA